MLDRSNGIIASKITWDGVAHRLLNRVSSLLGGPLSLMNTEIGGVYEYVLSVL